VPNDGLRAGPGAKLFGPFVGRLQWCLVGLRAKTSPRRFENTPSSRLCRLLNVLNLGLPSIDLGKSPTYYLHPESSQYETRGR
jgi:hypothetical protein